MRPSKRVKRLRGRGSRALGVGCVLFRQLTVLCANKRRSASASSSASRLPAGICVIAHIQLLLGDESASLLPHSRRRQLVLRAVSPPSPADSALRYHHPAAPGSSSPPPLLLLMPPRLRTPPQLVLAALLLSLSDCSALAGGRRAHPLDSSSCTPACCLRVLSALSAPSGTFLAPVRHIHDAAGPPLRSFISGCASTLGRGAEAAWRGEGRCSSFSERLGRRDTHPREWCVSAARNSLRKGMEELGSFPPSAASGPLGCLVGCRATLLPPLPVRRSRR